MPANTDHLAANEGLARNQSLRSANGIYDLVFQADSNLVLYKRYPSIPARALWASNTVGSSATVAVMQGDGNLVLYDAANHPVWASNTHGNPGSRLVLQDDGNGVIYRANNSPAWATNTVQRAVPNGPTANGADMQPGEVLHPGNSIQSANGTYLWTFQTDGNLVLYKRYPNRPDRALWASNTHGKPAWVCIMQADGNLVIYDVDGNPLWAAGTHGNPGSRFVMQDDGNGVIYRPNNSPAWATNTVQRAVPNGPTASGADMQPGEVLHPGNSIQSANGTYLWTFQTDGNLVLYKRYPGRPDRALWASNTHGKPAWVCIMQADGNLVIYDVDGNPLWATGTHGNPGSRFVMQDDGNGVIYRPNNSPAWATNTVQRAVPNGPTANGADMQPGEVLHPGNSIQSANGTYLWTFQTDGNLVLYKRYPGRPDRALWASNTHGKPASVCIMQADGNLVIYDIDGNPLWAAGTHGNPGSRFVMQDDGNGVIYRPNNSPAWATNTVQRAVPNGPTANGADMQPGEVLHLGNSLRSANGNYLWIFQNDGNLVLYKAYTTRANQPLWASNTHGKPAWVCIMQGDGNLVIYDIDGGALWASNTHGNPGSRFVIQDDGNGVIYRPNNSPTWATRTNGARIHFKTLVARTNAIDAFIAAQFTDMDELFISGRVNVILGTVEDLSGDAALAGVRDLDVGDCTLGNPTAEHNTLFARRNNVAANELVVYVVRTLVGGTGNFLGCATHPNNQPGCAIVQSSARWLTAHEIGHVLGLRHVSNADRLMNPNVGWTNVPPDLDDGEYTTMRDSNLTP